jgi:capsule polysaccharide export protein KpsE/RkpR
MAFDLSWLPALTVSVATLIGGAIYASKKGLPDLVAKADRETAKLVDALEGQLAIANAELSKLRPQLASAQVRIEALEAEVERLEKRVVKLIIRIASLEEGKP